MAIGVFSFQSLIKRYSVVMSGKRKAEQSGSAKKTLDEALGVAVPAPGPTPPQTDNVVRALMGALVTATRATNSLPGAEGGGIDILYVVLF